MHVKQHHLTYCSNIHPGESWAATKANLEKYLPEIKSKVSGSEPLAIGLRLSNEASLDILKDDQLPAFKRWLDENGFYIFTFNGFPYGGFHRQVVKDEVHTPDWTTADRKAYTLRLFDILSVLLAEGMDGGISTSPLSYKYWHPKPSDLDFAMQRSTEQVVEVAVRLFEIYQQQGKLLHLDIEPEPDGLIENSEELISFFSNWLLPLGVPVFKEKFGLTDEQAEKALKEHIRVCYDICHFAVGFEHHQEVFDALDREGIKIGKIQISAALKVPIPVEISERKKVEKALHPFVESTYLHQVVGKRENGSLKSFRDLPDALVTLAETKLTEWRIHFHVPIFLDTYGRLASTQGDITEVLKLVNERPLTNHLEIETYTWEVLPEDIHLSLGESISRELLWTLEKLQS
ncbi:MAG: metabolite traffic protein EboE [Lunatimonas sp.]|uniref:metabolite traffic protein EboE n=1 Tax=Lunatimonas sp. TaxID=2060141 RepID=UPI00263BB57C|nr:metabolite traffic protein EboE [Lunatimonas sp.]MCC5937843.1 metabolite traffic protein EboE [Lunatimonas sp.]